VDVKCVNSEDRSQDLEMVHMIKKVANGAHWAWNLGWGTF